MQYYFSYNYYFFSISQTFDISQHHLLYSLLSVHPANSPSISVCKVGQPGAVFYFLPVMGVIISNWVLLQFTFLGYFQHQTLKSSLETEVGMEFGYQLFIMYQQVCKEGKHAGMVNLEFRIFETLANVLRCSGISRFPCCIEKSR